MIRALKLVVFDWDGTLMDSTDRIVSSFQHAMRRTSLPLKDETEIRAIIGLGLPEAIAELYPEVDAARQAALARAYTEYYLALDPTPVRPYPGAKALLEELAGRGFWLAVATGKSRRGLDKVLSETGFARYFFATRCAEETASKPHPKMLEELMFEAGAKPEVTLMVGDTWFDLDMARQAKVPSVGLAHGAHAREQLEPLGPITIFDDLASLQGWFEHINLSLEDRV